MKYSIFHTSHCGSTLLTKLLSSKIESYSEPYWTHRPIRINSFILDSNAFHKEETLVKYPSGVCPMVSQVSGKKIFLYRNLKEHLFKFRAVGDYQFSYYFNFFLQQKHPATVDMPLDSKLQKHVFLWVNRVLWIQKEKEILWVKSRDFFAHKEKELKKITTFFEIPAVTNLTASFVDVKKLGYNGNDIPIHQVVADTKNVSTVRANHGIIPEELINEDEEILQVVEILSNSSIPIDKSLY